MDKIITWLIRGAVLIVMGGCLLAYLNLEKKPSLIFSKPTIEDLKYKELDKKRANAEFAAKRDSIDYDKFGSSIFCNSSMNSWIESVNYSKQMDLYIFGKDADLSEWDNVIKDYVNKRSRCRDFNPLRYFYLSRTTVSLKGRKFKKCRKKNYPILKIYHTNKNTTVYIKSE